MSSSSKSTVVVVQRYRSARLLLDEKHWVAVPETTASSSDKDVSRQQHCGLLLYVSFAAGADKSSVYTAAETCVNLPVLTTGLWGDGVSEQPSLRELLLAQTAASQKQPETTTSVTIVPQANLISKVKSQGKSIQYHGQIEKNKGEDLYNYFCDCLRAAVYELQCGAVDALPDWFVTWKTRRLEISDSDGNSQPKALEPSIPPEQVFRSDPKYGSFDQGKGMPLTTADGEPLTKSASKKLRKLYDAHAKRHAKWKETASDSEVAAAAAAADKNKSNETTNDAAYVVSDDTIIDWTRHLQVPVVAGSFGKRQGLEIKSDMGPFCHVFQV